MPRLFVYGTLMRGGPRHHLLAGQQFLGVAHTVEQFALFDLGTYPGMVRCSVHGHAVAGEVYEVEAEIIPLLDRAEGAPELYRLEIIELAGDANTVSAYVYQRDVSRRPLAPDGRWRNSPS